MIYFISSLPENQVNGDYDVQPVKIGYSATREGCYERLTTLRCGNAQELIIEAIMPGSMKDEAWLHEIFAADRIRGEWFRRNRWIAQLMATWNVMRASYCKDGWTDAEFDAYMEDPSQENLYRVLREHGERRRDPSRCNERIECDKDGFPVRA